MLRLWSRLSAEDALDLLDTGFADVAIRAHTVEALKGMPDDMLLAYLLQLTQVRPRGCPRVSAGTMDNRASQWKTSVEHSVWNTLLLTHGPSFKHRSHTHAHAHQLSLPHTHTHTHTHTHARTRAPVGAQARTLHQQPAHPLPAKPRARPAACWALSLLVSARGNAHSGS